MNQAPPRPETLLDWGEKPEVEAPADAFRFAGGPVQFAEPGADGAVPITMVARSGKLMYHWWWGRVVHDLAGMHRHKPTLPIDYAHYETEILGYLDQFDSSSGDLVVKGQLIPFTAGDRTGEVIHKGRAGVPYESSIFWHGPGIKVEEIDADSSAEVNGYTIEGPVTIIRSWPLRGVAICPYGADPETPVSFTATEPTVTITRIRKGTTMPTKAAAETDQATDTPKPGDDQATEQAGQTPKPGDAPKPGDNPAADQAGQTPKPGDAPKPGDDQAADAPGPGHRFLEAFGPQGGVWFAEGKSFDDAQTLYCNALRHQVDDLTARLAATDRGLGEPADFTPAPDLDADRQRHQLNPGLGDNLARVAAGLKFRRN